MIKFFRKIRQQLLAENKFSKYLVYAVGEIVLVVIGILIALQLNALKQEKEDRNYELILLKNIRHEIFSDILYHKSLYENAKARDLISQHLLNSYGTENDSLALALYPIISKGISFAYRKGAYEALKSTGLDKISNNSLRDHLTTMYDFGLPLISRSLDEIETNKTILVEKLEQELFAPAIIIDDQGNKNINLVPREGNLLNDDRLLSLIRTNQFKGKEFMKEVEKVFPNTELLLSQLNNELKGVYPILSIEEEKIKSIGILGSATEEGWEKDLDMYDENKDGIFILETILTNGEIKFRANDKWATNWGGYTFPLGYYMPNGENITVKSGHYKISFNTKNGTYQFDRIAD